MTVHQKVGTHLNKVILNHMHSLQGSGWAHNDRLSVVNLSSDSLVSMIIVAAVMTIEHRGTLYVDAKTPYVITCA